MANAKPCFEQRRMDLELDESYFEIAKGRITGR